MRLDSVKGLLWGGIRVAQKDDEESLRLEQSDRY